MIFNSVGKQTELITSFFSNLVMFKIQLLGTILYHHGREGRRFSYHV